MKQLNRMGLGLLAVLLIAGLAGAAQVTFNVDLSYQQTLGNFDPNADGVGIRGTMNGWAGADGLVDNENDLTYTTTLELDSGYYEYKFVIWIGNNPDNLIWEDQINNRTLDVSGDPIDLPLVWFNNNSPAVTNYEITFRVNMDRQRALGVFDPNTDAVIIRGGRGEIGNWDGYTPVPRMGESMLYMSQIQFDDFDPGNQLDYKFLIDYDNDQADPVEWEQVGGPFDNRHITPDGSEPDNDQDGYLEVNLDPAWFSLAEPAPLGNMYVGPYNAPVVVPAAGGPVAFDVHLHNNLNNNYPAELWVSAVLPNSNTYNLAPVNVNIPAGVDMFFEHVSVNVPGMAPTGNYTLAVNAGNYPNFVGVSDSFDFTKLAVGAGGTWSVNGLTGNAPLAADNAGARVTLPSLYAVSTVYPNPFNPSTTVTVTLPDAADLTIRVFNLQGRLVDTLAKGTFNPGQHQFTFDASDLASGLYFVQTSVPGHLNSIQKVTLMK